MCSFKYKLLCNASNEFLGQEHMILTTVSVNDRNTEQTQGIKNCTCSLLLSCCVAWCNCCWFFFLTSCSATLISSKVTPWVDLRVSLTRFAWAFLCVSDSSSRTGGTNDLHHITVCYGLICQLLTTFWNGIIATVLERTRYGFQSLPTAFSLRLSNIWAFRWPSQNLKP